MPPGRLRLAVAALALVAGVAFAAVGGPTLLAPEAAPPTPAALPAPSSGGLRFDLSEAGVSGVEMTLGVTSKGTLFVGGWDGVARSRDDGATWERLRLPVEFPADRVLLVDRATDRVFVSDTTLACTILSWSDDEGDAWSANPVACGGGVTDHQKVAVGPRTSLVDPTGSLYPNVVYLCYNSPPRYVCATSVDGGRTFLPAGPHNENACSLAGPPVADARGTLYVPSTMCRPQLLRTDDNGLTWTLRKLPFDATGEGEPTLAATPDGTLYFFFIDDAHLPALARSADGGATWSDPFRVAPPDVVSAAYPVVVAGDDGRLGLAFYGTTDAPEGWDREAGAAPDEVRWHGYVAVVTDATAGPPALELVRVTPEDDPLERGCITLAAGCRANLREYTGIDVGPDGRVHALFIDNCPPGCTSRAEAKEETPVTYKPGGPRAALVAIQRDGPRLRG